MSDMGHCYGNDLRRRVVEAVTGGLSARGAAARFRVAPATAIHWRRRWRETGSIEPDRQGQPPGSKLDAHEAFILALVAQTKAMTLAEIGEKLPAHKVAGIRQAIEAAGATLLYLPPYSPDCNPIEMAFAKLKALLRKAAARTVDDLWDAIAEAIDAFTSTECENYFAAAGYDRD